ncbi:MAG: type II toxin-antitoxin system MqsA family antitoxin, partial [Blastocatellia bacterium]
MNEAAKQKRIKRSKASKGQLQICSFCGKESAHEVLRPQAFGEGESLLVIENVPTIGCDNCGVSYFSGKTVDELERIIGNPD